MHEGNAELLRAVDPRALGGRLKAARVSRGITQSALAGDGISSGYVSRIESGVRRPTLKVLTELARRLDKPVDQLLRGVSSTEYDEIRLGLDYAELALENGEGEEAERHARDALTRAELASLEQFQSRGHYLLGRAYETLGRLDDAVRELEHAVASDSTVLAIRAGIALTRCHRNLGDLTLAIEVGERIQATLPALGLDRTDEAVQLAMTVASGYIDRGDLSKAARLCADVMRHAEEWASPAARSAAYWSASVALSERGQIQDAVALATRALALQGEGNDTRNLARLRLSLGRLELRMDPAAVPGRARTTSVARGTSSGGPAPESSTWLRAGWPWPMPICGRATRSRPCSSPPRWKPWTHRPALPERAEAAMIRGQAAWALQRTDEAWRPTRSPSTSSPMRRGPLHRPAVVRPGRAPGPGRARRPATTALRTAARASGLQSGRRLDARQPITR